MLFRVSILTLSLFLSNLKCSVVIDTLSEKGLHLEDYCSKTEFCPEGAHVMCMYYNPNRELGEFCFNPSSTTFTPDIKTDMLNLINAARSKVALGLEKGKDEEVFPRGYGMYKLEWDEELAMFAQVLANQCLFKHDICRPTKKFPNPGQNIGVIRFKYPDWSLVTQTGNITIASSLTTEKLKYAIIESLKLWYTAKESVTNTMLASYPDLLQLNSRAKVYLELITGSSTHMGCGVKGFTDYTYTIKNIPLIHNTIIVICNFSASPQSGTAVYTMTPPTKVGYTIKCGCPENYDEDADCLCVNNRKNVDPPSESPNFCPDGNCKPTVILLPIFTVEDAPPNKLLPRSSDNKLRIGQSVENFKRDTNNKLISRFLQPRSLSEFKKFLQEADITKYTTQPRHSSVQRHFVDSIGDQRQPQPGPNPSLHHDPLPEKIKKQSVFSRAAKFQIPTTKIFNLYPETAKKIKKDVAPRRDFSNVQKLLKSYLYKKRNHIGNTSIFKGDKYEYTSNERPKVIFDNAIENNTLRINKMKNTNNYSEPTLNGRNLYATNGFKVCNKKECNEDADKKLMLLLDNLEKEVKHIELDSKDKEIFDAKLRKIYGTVLGKQDLQYKATHFVEISTKQNIENSKNLFKSQNTDTEYSGDRRFMGENHRTKVYDNGLDERYETNFRNNYKNHENNLKAIYSFEETVEEFPSYTNRNRKNDTRYNKSNFRDYENESYRNKELNPNSDIAEDLLSYETRRHYQEKLDDLERKLQIVRGSRHHVNPSRKMRPVLSTSHHLLQRRPRKSQQIDTFYIPDRARSVHGF